MNTTAPRLIHGQRIYPVSAETMADIDDASIDVIVTSPPYNRGKVYSGDNQAAHNDRLDDQDYHDLLGRVFSECFRVLRDDGLFFLNIGDAAADQGKSERVVETAVAAGFQRIQTIVWVKSLLGKGHYTPSGRNRRLNNCWENVYMLARSPGYRLDPLAIGIPYADKSNIGRYGKTDLRDAGNVWLVPYARTTGHAVKKGHDAPFPLELPWRCIRLVPDARRVLDPFGGTMSTLAAARSLGLEGIGFEPYPRWSVIEQCLNEGARYAPPPLRLIPDLEQSTSVLLDLVKQLAGPEPLHAFLRRHPVKKRDRELLLRLLDAPQPEPSEPAAPTPDSPSLFHEADS